MSHVEKQSNVTVTKSQAWTISRRGSKYRDDEAAELAFRVLMQESAWSDVGRTLGVDLLDHLKAEDAIACLDGLRAHVTFLGRLLRRAEGLAVTVTDGPPCAHCGRPIRHSDGRPVLYCSRSCRQRAYEARKRDKA